ncbi:hypothetical protein AAAX56_08780 [Hominicoprocola fusiformis]
MPTNSVSARFQELFPETNLISLLTKYGGDAGDIFETLQDQYGAHEQEPLVGLLGIKADEHGVAAAIAAAADNLISHPENDDIDWTPDEFVSDWNDLHRGEEPLK